MNANIEMDKPEQNQSANDTLSVNVLNAAGKCSRKASSNSSEDCFADFAFEASDRDGKNSPTLTPEEIQGKAWAAMHIAAEQSVTREIMLRGDPQMTVSVASNVQGSSLTEDKKHHLEILANDPRVNENQDRTSTRVLQVNTLSVKDMSLEENMEYPISLNVSPRLQGAKPQIVTVSLPYLEITSPEGKFGKSPLKPPLISNVFASSMQTNKIIETTEHYRKESMTLRVTTADIFSESIFEPREAGMIENDTDGKGQQQNKDDQSSKVDLLKSKLVFRMDMLAGRNKTKTDFKTDTGGSNLKLAEESTSTRKAKEGASLTQVQGHKGLPRTVSDERAKVIGKVAARATHAIYPTTVTSNISMINDITSSANRRDRLFMESKGRKALVHSIVSNFRLNATPKRRKLNKTDSKVNEIESREELPEGEKLTWSRPSYSKKQTKLQIPSNSINAPQFIRDIVTKTGGSSHLRTRGRNTSSNASVKRSCTRDEFKPARSDRLRLQELLGRLSKLYPTSLGLAYDTAAEFLALLQHSKAVIAMEAPLPRYLVAAVWSVACLLGLSVSAGIGKLAIVQSLAKELVCGLSAPNIDLFSNEEDSNTESKNAFERIRLM